MERRIPSEFESDEEYASKLIPLRLRLERGLEEDRLNPEVSRISKVCDDEPDPLDAYMESINQEVIEQSKAPPKDESKIEEVMEPHDDMNAYILKGTDIGHYRARDLGFDENSDEEVYSAAHFVDLRRAEANQVLYEDDFNHQKTEIKLLNPIDHSKITYRPIVKDFYKDSEYTQMLTENEVAKLREEFDINVSGTNVPKPGVSFGHFMFDEKLLDLISQMEFVEPTNIQRQAVPTALNGRNIIGLAETGSGKSYAFIWPMLVHVNGQRRYYKRGGGPAALILASSRELAQQLYLDTKKFSKAFQIKCALVTGGSSKGMQFKELRHSGVEVVVATPGRLIDLVRKKVFGLHNISFLVLDEADKMLDFGFEPQVRSICSNVRPDVQMLLFSATFSEKVELLTQDFLIDPVKISIGRVGQANSDIVQNFVILKDQSEKWPWLLRNLPLFVLKGSVLIFASKKVDVDALAANLNNNGFSCVSLHGDMFQQDRDTVFSDYKSRKVPILVSTDIAARGIDVKHINTVVSYDAAKDINSYTHRIGRTGRAKEKGEAYTLMVGEDRLAGDIVLSFKESGKEIPEDLLKLAMRNARFRKKKGYLFKKDGEYNQGYRPNYRRECFYGAKMPHRAETTGANSIPVAPREFRSKH